MAECPCCQKPLNWKAGLYSIKPFQIYCPHCRRELTIHSPGQEVVLLVIIATAVIALIDIGIHIFRDEKLRPLIETLLMIGVIVVVGSFETWRARRFGKISPVDSVGPVDVEALQRQWLSWGLRIAHYLVLLVFLGGLWHWGTLLYDMVAHDFRHAGLVKALRMHQSTFQEGGKDIWKCLLPLAACGWAIWKTPRHLKRSLQVWLAVLLFSGAAYWYDVTNHRWQWSTWDYKTGTGTDYYCTWWWHETRWTFDNSVHWIGGPRRIYEE